MEVDFGVYGVRQGQKGWKRSTSYHPYEFREGTAEEKIRLSASGTGKRLLDGHNGESGRATSPEARDSGKPIERSAGGQARNPFQR